MGITDYNFQRMLKYLPVDSLCELGDQWLFISQVPHHTFSKDFFERDDNKHLVNEYVSVDYMDRPSVSLRLDLNKDIHEQSSYDGAKYDLVTDFGTLEHCGNYYQALKNAYDLCKVGGVMIFSTPKVNNWPGHCFHTFTKEFFIKLCEITNMEILFIEEFPACDNVIDGWEICVETKKTNNKFPTKEEFNKQLRELYSSIIDEDAPGRSQMGLTEKEAKEYAE